MQTIHDFVSYLMITIVLPMVFYSCTSEGRNDTGNLRIGWSSVDITPDKPVLLGGQSYARISEGVMDPITVTALAIESDTGHSSEKVIMVSCDLINISDSNSDESAGNLLDNVRRLLNESLPDLKPEKIFLNATHTHSAPYYGTSKTSNEKYGVDLDEIAPSDYLEFVSIHIAQVAEQAWKVRKPAGISYGLGQAVVGHNRLQVDMEGKSLMYGNVNRPEFSHIEGYEDHSVNLLYTWDKKSKLTGVVINIACPSQVSENSWLISADYWHNVREEIHQSLGDDIFILPQCSAAGDQSPHIMIATRAEERMQQLMFPGVESGGRSLGRRKQIALKITNAVVSTMSYTKNDINWDPVIVHKMEKIELSRRLMEIEDVNDALKLANEYKNLYDQILLDIQQNPEIKEKPGWYVDLTRAFTRSQRGPTVKERFELQKTQPKMTIEVHVVRIGDIVIATNPFELYLDYGMRIKGRSPAIQTFLVQLAGSATYLPTSRSVAGKSYGAVPASTLIGPEGGQELVEKTLEMINNVME